MAKGEPACEKRAKAQSLRKQAVKAGLAPKARKAFVIFFQQQTKVKKGACKTDFLNEMRHLAGVWKKMTKEQQAPYQQMSKDEFEAQRSALVVCGIKVRGSVTSKARSNVQDNPPAVCDGQLGPYRLYPGSHIGGGSYGNVYRSQHPDSGCNVAVKVYRGLEAEDDCRYEVEQLKHLLKTVPGHASVWFPALIDAAVTGKPWPWMAAELWGPSLKQVLRLPSVANQLPPKPTAWSVATQLRSALRAMHGAHVLHLDVKPGNVLWCPDTDQMKLCDFGMSESLARLAKPKESPRFQHYVTAAYRAPELWALARQQDGNYAVTKKLLRPAVDMWAYGCVVYEVETGHHFMTKPEPGVRAWCQEWPELWKKASQGKLAQSAATCHANCAKLLRAPKWALFILDSCAPDPSKRRWPELK